MPITVLTSTRLNEVLWNNGEGITLGDLNDAQRYTKALLLDYVMGEGRAWHDYTGTQPSPDPKHCYVPHALSAFPYSSTARVVNNNAGVLMQWTGSSSIVPPDGLTPAFKLFPVADGQLATTLSIGDATNPRVDAIFIKIEEIDADSQARDFEDAVTGAKTSQTFFKKKRTQLSKNVIEGTPGANPLVPATPAGYVPWCYVYVPATHNAAFTNQQLHDKRMPVRRAASFTPAGSIYYGGAVPGNSYVTLDTSTDEIFIPFLGPPFAKIVAVRLIATINNALGKSRLVRYRLNAQNQICAHGTNPHDMAVGDQLQDVVDQGSNSGLTKGVIWGNGWNAGPRGSRLDADNGGSVLAWHIEADADSTSSQIYGVTWEYAY